MEFNINTITYNHHHHHFISFRNAVSTSSRFSYRSYNGMCVSYIPEYVAERELKMLQKSEGSIEEMICSVEYMFAACEHVPYVLYFSYVNHTTAVGIA